MQTQKQDHEIIAEGQEAEQLINNEFFNAMYREFTSACFDAIANSKPHETKLREFEYAKLQAIMGFNGALIERAMAAHNLLNKPQDDDADDVSIGPDEE